jgi:prepilin-type N-terminal cleavage/methylation domain-containing protein
VCGQTFSDSGERATDNAFRIRLAKATELGPVLELLKANRLPVAGLAEHVANLLVAVEQDRIVGSAALACMRLSLDAPATARPAAPHHRRAAGYSILELIIAIVVFGILLSVAYMRMTPAVNHARVNRAAGVIANDLQYAQMLAVRQRVPVAVIVDNALKAYIIRLRDTSVTFRDRFFGQDTEYLLDTLAANPASVVMFPNGVAAATTTFTVGLGGYTRRVRLSRGGQVRIVP